MLDESIDPMPSHRETAWLVVRHGYNLWSALSALLALAILSFSGLLGLKPETGMWKTLRWLDQYRWHAACLFCLVALYAAAHTALVRAEQQFYATHPRARREHVKCALDDLVRRGKAIRGGQQGDLVGWDREVCERLGRYLIPSALVKYLEATRGHDRGPLEFVRLDTALNVLRSYAAHAGDSPDQIVWRGESD